MTEPSIKTELSDMAQISVASRIPEFWIDQPRLWFLQIEAILAPQKLADEAKYNLVVTKLGKNVIAQVADFLMKPPESKKFETLKDKLLAIYEESETRKLQKLIGEMDLGDQRPSQLLSRMKDLARGKISEETLRLLWQGHLPISVRAVLTVADSKDLDKLAIIADKVLENVRPMQISEVAHNTNADNTALITEIAKISTRVASLETSIRRRRPHNRNIDGNRFRSRNRSGIRSSSRNRRTPNSPDWLCYYHFRYRTRANKCVEPCNWRRTSEQLPENH